MESSAQTLPINIIIDQSYQDAISLKSLISLNNNGYCDTKNLAVSIVLDNDTALTVIDDLVQEHEMQTTDCMQHSIEFILHKASNLAYKMRMINNNQPATMAQSPSGAIAIKSLGACIIEKNLTVRLKGADAQATLVASCYGAGQTAFKFKTLQDHQVADASSNVLIKGVLDDKALLTCNSMISVKKDAQRTYAIQANKNILLTKTARAVSIPQLEIEANDVTCKHGAAVSSLREEDIFYLQSRGIDYQTTRTLLIEGFLQ